MLVHRARRSLPLLLAAALALSLTACTSEPEERPPATAAATSSPTATATASPEPTATPTPTPAPTPSPTVTPTPTVTPSPAPTPSPTATPAGTPSPTPTPTPTATPSPAPTATPSPTPTATPAPLITAEDLGIREVDTAEALAAAGLTHVRYAAGEEVPWDPGLFLLDVATGGVEGWVRSLAALSEEEREPQATAPEIPISPSNRFLSLLGALHDRQTERTYRINGSRAGWWGYGSDERLLYSVSGVDAFVALDAALQPVAQFQIPPGERFISPNGGYILVRECVECEPGDRFHVLNLEDETNPTNHTWTLPWKTVRRDKTGHIGYEIQLLDESIAVVAVEDRRTCRVVRYDLRGALLSDSVIRCMWPWESGGRDGYPGVSPDGTMVVAEAFSASPAPDGGIARDVPFITSDSILSIFNTRTGEETLRVKSMWQGWNGAKLDTGWVARALDDVWLADSSGIVVGTPHGPRIVTLNGEWESAPGRPSPADADLFYSVFDALPAVINRAGEPLASVSFGPRAPILGWHRGAYSEARADWGTASDMLRIRPEVLSGLPEGPSWRWPLPLAPVIERPPYEDQLLVEVVVDTCLNLREEPSLEASVVTCLPHGALVNMKRGSGYEGAAESRWMHLRTDDGLEGWASAEYLRWHSDGVWLEE